MSVADGELFLLKHLLALKSQIVAFDFEFVTPEVSFDFSSLTNTFWELRERGDLFNPRHMLRLMGGSLLPRVVENMLDAKVELDGRLRTVINAFTHSAAMRAVGSLSETASRRRGFNAAAAVQAARSTCEQEALQLRAKLNGYLTDARIIDTLVEAVYDQVVQIYESFYEAYKKTGQPNGRLISSKGKGREDDVWDSESFTDWAAKVFDITEIVAHDSDSDGMGDSSGISRAGSA